MDGRRACVRGGRAGHLPRRSDGVERRDGVGGRAKENIRGFVWIIVLIVGWGMIGGGIKGAVSVLFRDGIFSRWWLGALIAFGGLKLVQYLAVKLKVTSPARKRRKKRKGK